MENKITIKGLSLNIEKAIKRVKLDLKDEIVLTVKRAQALLKSHQL